MIAESSFGSLNMDHLYHIGFRISFILLYVYTYKGFESGFEVALEIQKKVCYLQRFDTWGTASHKITNLFLTKLDQALPKAFGIFWFSLSNPNLSNTYAYNIHYGVFSFSLWVIDSFLYSYWRILVLVSNVNPFLQLTWGFNKLK